MSQRGSICRSMAKKLTILASNEQICGPLRRACFVACRKGRGNFQSGLYRSGYLACRNQGVREQ